MKSIKLVILFLLLFNSVAHSQSNDLSLTLDSIPSIDNNNQRIFTIHYHIENKTNQVVSFILNPNSIRSNVSNALAWTPSYRLYQEDTRIDVESISSPITIAKNNKDFIDKMSKELRENKENLNGYLLKKQKEIQENSSRSIMSTIIMLNPHEIRAYAVPFSWDKNRYITYFDNEYYLDEKTPHYLDLVIILMKEELYTRLLPEDKNKIEANKTIIKGWLSSNKMEINFKE
jgi:hypothetical protein